MTIAKVAVIGSGVMGSGIAAQIANAGDPWIARTSRAMTIEGIVPLMRRQHGSWSE